MEKTWILLANAGEAILYNYAPAASGDKRSALSVIENFSHPDSRKKDQELTSDRQGAYLSSQGGHGTFTDSSDPHQYEAQVFARALFHVLEDGFNKNQYQKLILASSPHFMGLLRKEIEGRSLKNIPIQEIHKDYTKEKPQDLINLLGL